MTDGSDAPDGPLADIDRHTLERATSMLRRQHYDGVADGLEQAWIEARYDGDKPVDMTGDDESDD